MLIQNIDGVYHLQSFMAVTIGIIVLFLGRRLNSAIHLLREFSIPEPVSGGILFSIAMWILYSLFSVELSFDLGGRDILLVYFFVTIGINANLKDLLKGGRPLAILLGITIAYMFLQNFTGLAIAKLFNLESAVGILGGTVSLIGGHGTAIAWAPRIGAEYGIGNAMEIGIASATFGLILASLMGGPIAQFLIKRHKLAPAKSNKEDLTIASKREDAKPITAFDFLDAVLAIHICGIVGLFLNEAIEEAGLKLPLFVTCLFAGILISNFIPKSFPTITGTRWPSRTPAIALIADLSLGTFLAMSLMSMQLWTLIDLAGPIFTILGAQFIIAVSMTIFVVFPAMGRNYDAAVICAGFGGISLGSTPTAMANMAAVSQRYGNSHLAFIIVPLVCAFFIDLVNALLIPFFLQTF